MIISPTVQKLSLDPTLRKKNIFYISTSNLGELPHPHNFNNHQI